MSIFSAAGAAFGGLLGGTPGAAVGASIGGGIDRNAAAQESAQQAQAFSASQYASRYQTQVKDMEAAGLNPMLAYTQSPGASPQGVTYQPTNIAERAASDYSSAYNVQREGERIEADTRLKDAQKESQESMSKLNDAQRDLVNETVNKVKQEISYSKTDEQRVTKLIDVLRQEYNNLVKQEWNLTETGNMLRATTDKLRAEIPYIGNKSFAAEMQGKLSEIETKLKRLDLNSAEKFDNFGRDANQLRPILDVLKALIRPR